MKRRILALAAGAGLGASPLVAHAHVLGGDGGSLVAPTLVGLAATGAVYVRGALRLRSLAPRRRGVPIWRVMLFVLGLLVLAVALTPPVEAQAEQRLSAHMGQHLALVIASPVLLVLGQPARCFAWAVPPSVLATGRGAARRLSLTAAARGLASPLGTALVYSGVLLVWHAPAAYEFALDRAWAHVAQHATFLLGGLLFWRLVLGARRRTYGTALLVVVVTTFAHASVAAAMTFAGSPWYEAYSAPTDTRALTPLEDQQLAGATMWIGTKFAHLGAALLLIAGWIRGIETRRGGPRLREASGEPR